MSAARGPTKWPKLVALLKGSVPALVTNAVAAADERVSKPLLSLCCAGAAELIAILTRVRTQTNLTQGRAEASRLAAALEGEARACEAQRARAEDLERRLAAAEAEVRPCVVKGVEGGSAVRPRPHALRYESGGWRQPK